MGESVSGSSFMKERASRVSQDSSSSRDQAAIAPKPEVMQMQPQSPNIVANIHTAPNSPRSTANAVADEELNSLPLVGVTRSLPTSSTHDRDASPCAHRGRRRTSPMQATRV